MTLVMQQIAALGWSEWKLIRNWFSQQRLSKLVVIVGFGFLTLVVVGFIWLWSWSYMRNLATFEEYGRLTAVYLMKAAILLLGWLGIGSAVVANLSLILNKNEEVDYLSVLPVKTGVIVGWSLVRTVLVNWLLMGVGVIPIVMAYLFAFKLGVTGATWVIVMTVSLLLSMLVTGFGGLLAFLTARFWKRLGRGASLIGILAFFGVTTLLISRVIFPHQLRVLYFAEAEKFVEVYQSLPLLAEWWPSSWLVEMLLGDFWVRWWVIVAVMVLVLLTWQVEKILVSDLWKLAKERENKWGKSWFSLGSRGGLVTKDLLGVLRVPTEWGYGVLLMGMAATFFVLLRQATMTSYWSNRFEADMMVAAMGWLLFFSTSFGLRVLFPLMAREGRVTWWLFSLPISRETIISRKVRVGVILGLPLLVLSVGIWCQMPFVKERLISVSLFSGMVVAGLIIMQTLWGMVAPLFELADQPDRVSTSLSGLIALSISLVITGWSGWVVARVLKGGLDIVTAAGASTALGLIILLASYLGARMASRKYEF